ncbi:G-type lectin S-receptor-like serine/threonine-protein kinase At4g27290 isoform X2 [Zingiber officinale]|uniref:G-type lectin S-receptor-like serine/threonine-protein kinase At4g27290 isoform X2 n=1 Tax=Zingiber officinale TaxID=94328 RepID=UPI001C4CF13F|nr:G-type lectin S-receptor-like serine/threonine-protein kinase At4g27290 isoform X2 [Zingiber officinale]
MATSPPIAKILLLFSLHFLLCVSDNRLTPGQLMPSNETLTSGAFVLGFFSPRSSGGDLYLGIWYNISQRTVIWVANRESPVTDQPATLLFSVDDRSLRVVGSRGSNFTFWSANPLSAATEAVLLKNGNLVVQDGNGSVLWQSFDHPTDTFLPGMIFRYVHHERSHTRLTSWKAADDPSQGNFSFGFDSTASLQFMTWRGSEIYYRSSVWSGYAFTGWHPPSSNANSVIYYTVLEDEDGFNLTITVSDSSPYTRYTLNHSGQMQLLGWDSTSKLWQTFSSVPIGCQVYGSCGQFSYCNVNGTVPACRCLEGFEPRSKTAWSGGDHSGGCSRASSLRCGEADNFLRVAGMKLPDQFVFVRNKMNMSECRSKCSTNCSCQAFAYADLNVGNATVSRCLVWTGRFVDAEMITGGEDLYLKIMNFNSGASSGKSRRKILLLVLSISAAASALACALAAWKFDEQIKEGEAADQAPQLPLINFESLVLATDNFSVSNKLGQGGFGIVYKGILHGGQEIAIKRLIRGSGQGLVEFKNEINLIARLQHRNLVKLLGYCIHGEEKLLAYEYMPNKSLDFFLFDPVQKAKLDWGKRFNVIKGIARALVYLHQDSRLRIVHRDLKVSNILLDKHMNPKISDFGMAKIFGGNQNEANTKRVVGTYGYMSPEYAMQGLFSMKSDVYSFGVLLLEIVSGLQNSSFHLAPDFTHLLAYAWQLWNERNAKDFIDPSSNTQSCYLDEALRSIHVGLLCVQDSPSDRPAMSSVVFMLENETTISRTPKKPIFTIQRNDPSVENLETYSLNNMTITTIEGR